MTLTNIFQIIMFEKTSRCQTAVIFRLVSPILSYVRHLNHSQCRQHQYALNVFSFSKNRNPKYDNPYEYTTDKSTIYLLRFTKNNLPNPNFCFVLFHPALFHRWNEYRNEKSLQITELSTAFLRIYLLENSNCTEWLPESTQNKCRTHFVSVLVTASFPIARQLESFPYNPILF